MSVYREHLENYLKTIDVKADRVLDVGGLELPVKDRVKSWDVKEYKILDLPDYDINYEQSYLELANVTFCLEVMEYVYNPVVAIRNLYKSLSNNGILYITFPTLYPLHNPVEMDYMRYTKQGAIKLLINNGFQILECVPREIKHWQLYKQYVEAEGYKARGALKTKTLYDAGYIIQARKII